MHLSHCTDHGSCCVHFLLKAEREDDLIAQERGRVLLSLRYNNQKQQLVVTVQRCAALAAMDSNGYSDPYVKVWESQISWFPAAMLCPWCPWHKQICHKVLHFVRKWLFMTLFWESPDIFHALFLFSPGIWNLTKERNQNTRQRLHGGRSIQNSTRFAFHHFRDCISAQVSLLTCWCH